MFKEDATLITIPQAKPMVPGSSSTGCPAVPEKVAYEKTDDLSEALADASSPTQLSPQSPGATTSDRDPAGPLALFAAPATSALRLRTPAGKIAVSEEAGGRLNPRRVPLDPPPSAPHGPAAQPAGAAVAPPSEPTACSHLDASRLKPRKGVKAVRAGAPLTRPALATSARSGRRGRRQGAGRHEPGSSEGQDAARACDSPSITAASDTEHPVPRTPARWWPT